MPLFRKNKPPQVTQKDPIQRKYEEVVYVARKQIMTAYIGSLLNYWLQEKKRMPPDQQRTFLVGRITEVQNDIKRAFPEVLANPRLSYELKQWNYEGLDLPKGSAFGDASFRETLERDAVNPIQAEMIWLDAWIQVMMKDIK